MSRTMQKLPGRAAKDRAGVETGMRQNRMACRMYAG